MEFLELLLKVRPSKTSAKTEKWKPRSLRKAIKLLIYDQQSICKDEGITDVPLCTGVA